MISGFAWNFLAGILPFAAVELHPNSVQRISYARLVPEAQMFLFTESAMRTNRWVILLVFVTSSAFGQQPGTKDPTAVAIAQKALIAMGGTALSLYQDSTSTGTLTIYSNTDPVTFSITMQSKGAQKVRYDSQKNHGTETYVTDGNSACLTRPATGFQQLGFVDLYGQRIDHIPAFSLLAQYDASNMNVQYGGTANVNGQAADIITLSFAVNSPPKGFDPVAITQHNFYVEQVSGFVTKMQFNHFDDSDPTTTLSAELYFSNYQAIDGIYVPFSRSVAMNGKSTSNLTLRSVVFNTGLPDSTFDSSCGAHNGQ